MKIAITGAAGQVACQLAARPELAEASVRWIDRVALKPDQRREVVQAELTDLPAMVSAFEGVDMVLHLGAVSDPTGDNHLPLVSANVLGTATVLEAALTTGVRRLVFASSICATGLLFSPEPWVPSYLPVDEEHPALPLDYYGASKLASERMIEARTCQTDLQALALRFCSVYFPHQPGQRELFRDRAAVDEANGGRIRLWSYVHIDDLLDVLVAALAVDVLPRFSIMNVAASDTVAMSDTEALARRYFPGIPLRGPVEGRASLVSNAKLRRHLGVSLNRTWREDSA